MQADKIFDDLLASDDISWKAIILEAVKSGQMDPWDIDIAKISGQFIEMVSKFKQMNFKISGKVILAAAVLLKLKSEHFVDYDITQLDRLIASTESDENDFADEELAGAVDKVQQTLDQFGINRRTPQPRKRKVSVYDLILALEKAIEVDNRRTMRKVTAPAPQVKVPIKHFDITQSLKAVHEGVVTYYQETADPLMFSKLAPSAARNDVIYTFIPLLHLRNMHHVDLHQDQHFSDFHVELLKKDQAK